MDGNRNALFMELFKSIAGLFAIYYYGDWFFSSQHWPWYHFVVTFYLFFSAIAVSYFVLFKMRKSETIEQFSELSNS
jgi:hypothetical protein